MSRERYHIRVAKDYLIFSCGHFITYDGTKCEPLHGHNYRTAIELEADLDENHYVFDFIALRDIAKELTGAWDRSRTAAFGRQARGPLSRPQSTRPRPRTSPPW